MFLASGYDGTSTDEIASSADVSILPAPFYADAVNASLPNPPEFRSVPNAGHFDFLAPCVDSTQLREICESAPGFDRDLFHIEFNEAIVAFFAARLTAEKPS